MHNASGTDIKEILKIMQHSLNTESVITIDCDYICPQFAAAYLMIEGDQAAFIETNTPHAVPRLIETLQANGLTPEQVRYIAVSHIHLDHSGGAATLAKLCPNATILAHEKAAKHIIDPEKLVKGATAVYGEKKFATLYGNIESIDASRVRIMNDRERLRFGSRELEFIYTAGHAWHHCCVFDSKTNGVFSGDAFGLCYPILNTGSKPFIFPSTSPVGFDAAEARGSVHKIIETGAAYIYLTHFGIITDVEKYATMLLGYIDDMENIIHDVKALAPAENELENACIEKVQHFFEKELDLRGLQMAGTIQQILETDILLNGKGLAWAVQQID